MDISVIIPTYNEEKNIETCLKALQKQTLPRDRYEIIIVDGNSNDRTVEIAKKYADKVIQQKSKGIGGARNDGVKLARSELIATTDADTIVPSFWLKRIIYNFGRKKSIVAVYGPVEPIERNFKYRIFTTLINEIGFFLYKLGVFHTTVGSNSAFRKREFMLLGGYLDLTAGDDYEMGMRFRRMGEVYYDRRLIVTSSMRRCEKFGIIYTLYNWWVNFLAKKLNKTPKVSYSRQVYI
jgi:glycosyltransferase involved in cell wall biosynthesis